MTRRTLVLLMVCVNIALITTLMTRDLPRAYGQAAPLGANYLLVSAQETDDYDALYVLDLASRVLYVFEVDRSSKQFVLVDQRDLTQDFREGQRSKP